MENRRFAIFGVSCPEIEALIEAALGAGAYSAKLSGSGGGGIIIALVAPETKTAVASAITQAGGTALTPEIGVPGAYLTGSADCSLTF
jgi:mevalonate kinase